MDIRHILLITSIFGYCSVCFAQSGADQILAEPESENIQRIIGNMKLHGSELSFSNIKGLLEVERLQDISPPNGFPIDGSLKVYKLKNSASFLKNKKADFFCPKPAPIMLIANLSPDAIRVYFLQVDLATFEKKPANSVCTATNFDILK